MPKVSVIIPTYQHAEFLADAIDSVLAQTYKDYELIIVDDGSTDGTREIAARYINRIEYIYQDNKGLAGARNTGILAAKGQYIGFLDADDLWLPNKLEMEVQFLEAHPSVGLVYSDYTYFGTVPAPRRTGFDGLSLPSGHGVKQLFLKSPISSSGTLVRKECFEKVGLFDESFRQCEDLDMWVRIARRFDIDHIDIPLSKYRYHHRQMHRETESNLLGYTSVLNKHFQEFKKLDKKLLAGQYFGCGLVLCQSSDARYFTEGRKCVRKAFRLFPTSADYALVSLVSLFGRAALHYFSILLTRLFKRLRLLIDKMRPYLGFAYPVLNQILSFLLRR